MQSISFPYRPPGYLARQGYVKPLWLVKLRRSDNRQEYVPDDEAYNLPALKAKLESDKYSVSTIDHVTLELTRTDELVRFISGLSKPKRLSIKIFSYLIFRKRQKQLVWYGRLEKLPEGVDAYPWDKLKLTFTSAPGAWEDGDEVKDPNTKAWYKNKHVKDLLLPKFLKKAFAQAGPGGGRTYKLDEPCVRGTDYFWSGVDRPIKKLTGEPVPYDDTCKVAAKCWDSKRKLLYVGVHDGLNAPWLISYDPSTREWSRVTKFNYTGAKGFLDGSRWEVQHLEYSPTADKVFFVCRNADLDLLSRRAHHKCKGEINMASPPRTVSLTDNNLFTLHDKGISIRSRFNQYMNNHPIAKEGNAYYADAFAETIGWGTPRHTVKEAGVLWEIPRHLTYLTREYLPSSLDRTLRIDSRYYSPSIGQRVIVRDVEMGYQQYLGLVTEIKLGGQYWLDVVVEKYADYEFCHRRLLPNNCPVTFHWQHNSPSFNVFIAEPQEVQLEYLFKEGSASIDPVPVYVEARSDAAGRGQFHWPEDLGEISETSKFRIDRVGYTSFISIRELEVTTEKDTTSGKDYHYSAGAVAPYKITLKGYNPAYLIQDGFWVTSKIQDQGSWRRCQYQAGKCRLVHENEICCVGSDEIATYGDIFLCKEGANVYCAWNAHGRAEYGHWFSQCKVARWLGGKKFRLLWTDRTHENWFQKPESYIKSFAVHNGKFYLGRKYFEPNWVNTDFMIFWAAPPQDNVKPLDYGGGPIAICAIKGDRTDVIEPGDQLLLRFGKDALPWGRQYRVSSEVNTRAVEIGGRWPTVYWGDDYAVPEEVPYKGTVTWFALPGAAPWQVRGKYISVMKGRDERHHIMELEP